MICSIAFLLASSVIGLSGEETSASSTERYRSLIREIDAATAAYLKEVRSPHPDRAKLDALSRARDPQGYVDRFRELASGAPADPVAVDALVWMSNHGDARAKEDARATLADVCLASERILPVFRGLEHESGSRGAENLLRRAAARSPHHDVRGMASYWGARFLLEQAWYIRALQMPVDYWKGRTEVDIEPPTHIEGTYGKEALDRLASSDEAKVTAEAVEMYRRVLADYPDVEQESHVRGRRETIGKAASKELNALESLAIGRTAPDIVGEDTAGKPFRLSDYRGKVVVLDFGSQNYCSFCRDLIPQWRNLTKRLEDKPFALIGINADPDLAKLRTAQEAGGVTWRTIWDGDLGGPIFGTWDVRSWPTVYLIDRRGVIRHKNVFGKELDQAVDALLEAD